METQRKIEAESEIGAEREIEMERELVTDGYRDRKRASDRWI